MTKYGIILSGGEGTRLRPFTNYMSKHLLNVNGKPIIDFPIQTLKKMGVENLIVVLGGSHFSQVVDHLKDGKAYGMNIGYIYQDSPRGISQAISLCERYVGYDDFAVILGDNLFEKPIKWSSNTGAEIILDREKCNEESIKRFGIATINKKNEIICIEEKPKEINIKYRNYPITGCYRFDQRFFDFFKESEPSARGEFEIVDIINRYHDIDKLTFNVTDKESLWIDVGTHESIAFANDYFYKKAS